MTSDVVPAAGGGPSSSTGAALRPRAPRFAADFAAPRAGALAAAPALFFAAVAGRLVALFLAAIGLSVRSGNPRPGRQDRRIRRPPSSSGDRRARCGRRTAASRARSPARAPRGRALRHRRARAGGPRHPERSAHAHVVRERVSSCLLLYRRRVGPSEAPTSIIVTRSTPVRVRGSAPAYPRSGANAALGRHSVAARPTIIALR